MMTISEALYELGVRPDTLTDDEKNQLDEAGYLSIPQVMSADTIQEICRLQDELLAAEGDMAGIEVHREAGTDRLSDLINKGDVYHIVISQPRVLAAIAHVLQGDLQLSSLNSRAALPGKGLQGLHADWGRLETPGEFQVCNSMWLLDDYTPNNGATRVVPGTHRGTLLPQDVMQNTADAHPDEILLQGKAGDVVVVNSHTWHGGTLNTTDKPRRVMHGYFCRRHQPQQLDQQRYIRPRTWDVLSKAQRVVLGLRQRPQA
jgi:ectoine hydroxylase-related dioxygenase (phytanoyl-CoA dioxygenase family)